VSANIPILQRLSPETGVAAQDRQAAFLNADADRKTVAPDRVAAPASRNILQAGAVIPAAMITGI
jgi:type IV secretion system protein TrbI